MASRANCLTHTTTHATVPIDYDITITHGVTHLQLVRAGLWDVVNEGVSLSPRHSGILALVAHLTVVLGVPPVDFTSPRTQMSMKHNFQIF